MSQESCPNNREKLEDLLSQAGIGSYQELSKLTQIPERDFFRIESGLFAKMKLETIVKLAEVLHIPLVDLIEKFWSSPLPVNSETSPSMELEYKLLNQRQAELEQEFQRSVLNIIESWLLQWPTAIAAIAQNPQIPASKLLPLVQPLQDLLKAWGIEETAPVGAEIPYNPREHELIGSIAEPGQAVRVRYVGYRQGDKLLYRAKVSLSS